MVNVGDQAPDFTARGARGDEYRLSELRGKRVLLVFYPGDMTSGCTAQLSAIRDTFPSFEELDTVVFGVNPADAASHLNYLENLNAPFDLLVDEGNAIATAYGTLKPDGSGIQRTVIVVGRDGTVIFREQGAPVPGAIALAISRADD